MLATVSQRLFQFRLQVRHFALPFVDRLVKLALTLVRLRRYRLRLSSNVIFRFYSSCFVTRDCPHIALSAPLFLLIRGSTVRVFLQKNPSENKPQNANFATIVFFKNLSARIILVLYTTFMPNFTFLGLLSREISLGGKQKHKPSQIPRLFRHP